MTYRPYNQHTGTGRQKRKQKVKGYLKLISMYCFGQNPLKSCKRSNKNQYRQQESSHNSESDRTAFGIC
jgi:hypothetical protein